MKAISKALIEEVIQVYAHKIMERLQYKHISQGATKKRRTYTHVFIEGRIYGGHVGTFLCKTGWKTSHVYEAGSTMLDLCPTCTQRLRMLAEIIANGRPREILDVAANVVYAADITYPEIAEAIKEMGRRERNKKTKLKPIAMFDDKLLAQPIRKTQLCTIPVPSHS